MKQELTTWFRPESSRRDPPWGDLASAGTHGLLMDEYYAVSHEFGMLLADRVEVWAPELPRRFGTVQAVLAQQPGEVAEIGLTFRQTYPEIWAPFEARFEGDADYRRAAERLNVIEAKLDADHELLRAAFGQASVPEGLVIRQAGGSPMHDPFVEIMSRVAVVTDAFVETLGGAGLTTGWQTEAIEILDREGRQVPYRLLVISGRVKQHAFRAIARDASASQSDGPSQRRDDAPAIAGLVDRVTDIPTAIVFSPRTRTALEQSGLTGLTFEDVRHLAVLPER